jgi:tetratricopeptide (TPR) repeat protein
VYRHFRIIGATGIVLLLISAPAIAQSTPPEPGKNAASKTVTYSAGDSKVAIEVRVLGPNGTLLPQQALVRIFAKGASSPVKTVFTKRDSLALFYKLPADGPYVIEVIVPGYQTEKSGLDYKDDNSFRHLDFKMQPNLENLAVSDFTSSVPVPKKAQKRVDKGLAELQAGSLKRSQNDLTAARLVAPGNSDINYLLGLAYLRGKDLSNAGTYLTKAIAIDPKNVPALVALGQLRYQKSDFQGAEEALGKAVSLDPTQWLALWLLSDVHLRAGNFEVARKEAEDAVQLGMGAANAAEFVEGEALAELGRRDDATKVLQAFLRDLPEDPNAPAGKLEVNTTVSSDAVTAGSPPASERSFPVIQVPASKLLIPNWEPPGVDQEKPPVADGVTCPADQVIAGVGNRVAELVDTVNRIQAKEDVVHQELSTMGRPITTDRRKFEYLISIAPSDSGLLVIDENRDDNSGASQFAGHFSMFGLADLPLIFHPDMRGDFEMTCEGLGSWHDQATWLVYFRQRPDRPERLRSYQTLDGSYTAGFKGRAWISADTYQIVRLEANLIKPVPEVGLGSEEDAIEYGPVPFPAKNVVLWLPADADIYFYYHHRPFHRHHTFSNYLLFSVSASQKIGQPKITDQPENPQ